MKSTLVYPAAVLAVLATTAGATTLSLDFQPTGGTTAPGYLAFEAGNQVIPTEGTNYAAFGTTITVSLAVANLPDGNLDFRSVARNGTATDLTNDWIGVDTRNNGVDVTMTISVAGLPAGDYTWTSLHHDGGAGATNGNLIGLADIIFIDASGSTGLVADGISFSSQNIGNPISTFTRGFTANGTDPVSLSMIMDNNQGSGGTTNALFAFTNSLVIEQIPEPSSALLALAGALALGRRRRGRDEPEPGPEMAERNS